MQLTHTYGENNDISPFIFLSRDEIFELVPSFNFLISHTFKVSDI